MMEDNTSGVVQNAKKTKDKKKKKSEPQTWIFRTILQARVAVDEEDRFFWEYLIAWEPTADQIWPPTWHDFDDFDAIKNFWNQAKTRGCNYFDLRHWKLGEVVSTEAGARELDSMNPSLPSSTSVKNPDATRVYALWAQSNCFYPAIVQLRLPSGHYRVVFYDDDTAEVTVDEMRKYELRAGDRVQAAKEMDTGVVSEVNTDIVTLTQEGEISLYPIAKKEIDAHWEDRRFGENDEIVCMFDD